MNAGYLLDVNTLLALFWPKHEFHPIVLAWFRNQGSRRWATCPITQNGFVRVVSNPAFSRDALTVNEACMLLNANLGHPGHQFWSDEITLENAISVSGARLQGHRQITDAYLLGLAVHKKGLLVTLDGSIASLAPDGRRAADWVVDLSTAHRRP